MKKSIIALVTSISFVFITTNAIAHCEIPCGIYQDELRIELIKEHIQTIEKSMNKIIEIQDSEEVNYNQLIRWVSAKEEHANKIQDIAEQYFLTQRVKFAEPSENEKYSTYISQLTYIHQIVVYSMKAKQSTDHKYIEKLRDAVTMFEKAYFGSDKHRHHHNGDHK